MAAISNKTESLKMKIADAETTKQSLNRSIM